MTPKPESFIFNDERERTIELDAALVTSVLTMGHRLNVTERATYVVENSVDVASLLEWWAHVKRWRIDSALPGNADTPALSGDERAKANAAEVGATWPGPFRMGSEADGDLVVVDPADVHRCLFSNDGVVATIVEVYGSTHRLVGPHTYRRVWEWWARIKDWRARVGASPPASADDEPHEHEPAVPIEPPSLALILAEYEEDATKAFALLKAAASHERDGDADLLAASRILGRLGVPTGDASGPFTVGRRIGLLDQRAAEAASAARVDLSRALDHAKKAKEYADEQRSRAIDAEAALGGCRSALERSEDEVSEIKETLAQLKAAAGDSGGVKVSEVDFVFTKKDPGSPDLTFVETEVEGKGVRAGDWHVVDGRPEETVLRVRVVLPRGEVTEAEIDGARVRVDEIQLDDGDRVELESTASGGAELPVGWAIVCGCTYTVEAGAGAVSLGELNRCDSHTETHEALVEHGRPGCRCVSCVSQGQSIDPETLLKLQASAGLAHPLEGGEPDSAILGGPDGASEDAGAPSTG